MARYRIDEQESGVSIELMEVGGQQVELMEAFGECQAGQCSCPTDEYKKLAAMQAEVSGNLIRLRLEAKPGEKFDPSKITSCLDYTTAKVAEATSTD